LSCAELALPLETASASAAITIAEDRIVARDPLFRSLPCSKVPPIRDMNMFLSSRVVSES